MPTQTFHVNAMAPLYIDSEEGEARFRSDLELATAAGLHAVSVDVWWCKVKAGGEDSYDWSYYNHVFRLITEAGLNIVPIMAFHEFGFAELNEEKALQCPIPEWVWHKFDGHGYKGLTLDASDLQYKSETGNVSKEAVALWADELFHDEYVAFMKAFEGQYADYADIIDELNISCGATGELRYPSYNYHDQWEYPHRGFMQCYSRLAQIDFREAMLRKYGSVEKVGRAWDIYLPDDQSIKLPESLDDFIWTSAYRIPYGLDVFEWYNEALIGHGRNMIRAGIEGFSGTFKDIPLGIKIPGVHWNVANPHTPRISEIMAGIINTKIEEGTMAAGHGYAPIMRILSEVADERQVVLHFTCLEQDNRDYDRGKKAFSRARDLVHWVAAEARHQKVTIKGENAMALTSDERNEWSRIWQALHNEEAPYAGFTLLRLDQLRYSEFTRHEMSELSRSRSENRD